ncbi:hypothetical protein [Streptomyces sp. NPDC002104]
MEEERQVLPFGQYLAEGPQNVLVVSVRERARQAILDLLQRQGLA